MRASIILYIFASENSINVTKKADYHEDSKRQIP